MVVAIQRRAWVHVDMDHIIENAQRAGIRMLKEDVQELLRLWGFTKCGGDVWLCHEAALELLRDDEIKCQGLLNGEIRLAPGMDDSAVSSRSEPPR